MKQPTSVILQLKITLNDTYPPTWRRLQITLDSHFLDLHAAIQDAFGWEDWNVAKMVTNHG